MIKVKISTGSLFVGHDTVDFFGFIANVPLVRRRLDGDELNIVGVAVTFSLMADNKQSIQLGIMDYASMAVESAEDMSFNLCYIKHKRSGIRKAVHESNS